MQPNLADVLDALLAAIPAEQTAFRADLESIRRRGGVSFLQLPEDIGRHWRDTYATLVRHAPSPYQPWPDWMMDVAGVWSRAVDAMKGVGAAEADEPTIVQGE